jgi:hypothetical protein
LSEEAMEDPAIVASRVERIAMLVQRKMCGLATEATDSGTIESKDSAWHETSLDEDVRAMDKQRRKNDSRNERMIRRIAEATSKGMSTDEAFRLAISDEGFPETGANDNSGGKDFFAESLFPDNQMDETTFTAPPESWNETNTTEIDEQHPAVKFAEIFLCRLTDLPAQASEGGFETTLIHGAMDMLGGLAQATASCSDHRVNRALAITQLKRALCGHAFARGAVFGLSGENAIAKEVASDLHQQLETIVTAIHELLQHAWEDADQQ